MPCLNKDALCKPLALKRERYALPEYGPEAYVNIRELTSRDLLDLQASHGKEGKGFDFSCDLLARVLVDDDGQPLFASPDEVKAGLNLPLPALDALQLAALGVSGIDAKQTDDAKNG